MQAKPTKGYILSFMVEKKIASSEKSYVLNIEMDNQDKNSIHKARIKSVSRK